MKMTQIISNRIVEIVRQFGRATLVRDRRGRHKLIGGTVDDVLAAQEWVSLFAHEIVFDPSRRPAKPCCQGRRLIPPAISQHRAGFFRPMGTLARARF